jgi:transposase
MSTRFYDSDLTDAAWAFVAPVLPVARPGGRPRTTNLRAVLNAIFYLLRTGCQWRRCHANFHRVARSTITFKPGETPVRGSIYIECSTSRPVVMQDGQLVHPW